MKNFDEKMTYVFEGSGAPEAKLKPRESSEDRPSGQILDAILVIKKEISKKTKPA